uniref:Methyltransferase-like protein 22 n=1 Tax=Anopheles epiroticus TaxID=199890 RepID=A0A182PKE9_9DIPT
MSVLEVTSELYGEAEFCSTDTGNGNAISKFTFVYPNRRDCAATVNGGSQSEQTNGMDKRNDQIEADREEEEEEECYTASQQSQAKQPMIKLDKDGDVVVERRRKGAIEIELGSGVGLTSIVASMYAREVICTDIDIEGLLDLIRGNVQRNAHLSNPHCRVHVTELDFKVSYQDYPRDLKTKLQDVQYVIAADVIYDDDITEAFVRTIVSLLLELPKLKAIYIALEKRYVFTLEDMDSVAPCYDYFLRYFEKRNGRFGVNRWKLINVCMNFPRYFDYDKVKDLVLLKVCHASK